MSDETPLLLAIDEALVLARHQRLAALLQAERGHGPVLVEGPVAITGAELRVLHERGFILRSAGRIAIDGGCIAVGMPELRRPPPLAKLALALQPLKVAMQAHEHHARRVEVARRWNDPPVPPRSNGAAWGRPLAAALALLGWRWRNVDGNQERGGVRCESR